MPVLRNPQHERAARAYVEFSLRPDAPSGCRTAAYVEAGYSPGSPANAAKLFARPEIAARVDELMAEALAPSDIRLTRAGIELDCIALANVLDLYDTDGNFKPVALLPRSLAAAVRRIEFYGDGRVKYIELHDKVRALQVITRHAMADDRPQHTYNTQVNVAITDEQRIAALMTMLAKAKNGSGSGNGSAEIGGA